MKMACSIQLVQVRPVDPDAGTTGFLFRNGEMILEFISGEVVSYILHKQIDLDAAELGFESDEDWDWKRIKRILKKEGRWKDGIGIVEASAGKGDGKKKRRRNR